MDAVMVTVDEPGVVGVPERTPVVPFRVRPAGRAPALTVNVGDGVPEAVTVNAYGVPATGAVGVPEVMDGLDVVTGVPGGGHPVGRERGKDLLIACGT